jgi:hypothetical protein
MEYKNEQLGCSFSLPDELTIRQQLLLRTRVFRDESEDAYSQWWAGILPLIEDWQCEEIPDPVAFDLDDSGTWQQGNIVQWVSNMAAGYVIELGEVPKE